MLGAETLGAGSGRALKGNACLAAATSSRTGAELMRGAAVDLIHQAVDHYKGSGKLHPEAREPVHDVGRKRYRLTANGHEVFVVPETARRAGNRPEGCPSSTSSMMIQPRPFSSPEPKHYDI